jgi:uncharacterized membrane protein
VNWKTIRAGIVWVLLGLLLAVIGLAKLDSKPERYCGEVTYQNSTQDRYGSPHYWLELKLDDGGTKQISVTGSALANANLGDRTCFLVRGGRASIPALLLVVVGIVLFVLGLMLIFTTS